MPRQYSDDGKSVRVTDESKPFNFMELHMREPKDWDKRPTKAKAVMKVLKSDSKEAARNAARKNAKKAIKK